MTDEELAALCNGFIADHVEYEEHHGDAGNEYAVCVGENGRYLRQEQIAEVRSWAADVSNKSDDHISSAALEAFVMRPGNIYGPTQEDPAALVLDSFHIGEHEISLWDAVSNQCEWEQFVRVAVDGNSVDAMVMGTGCAYAATDAVWYAVLPLPDFLNWLGEV
jgi:hypothetical protein